MSTARFGRGQKAFCWSPLARPVGGAWTASIAGVARLPPPPRPNAGHAAARRLTVPTQPSNRRLRRRRPAPSLPRRQRRRRQGRRHGLRPPASRRRPNTAYQRAETVINAADAVPPVLAAGRGMIGRVESDHGRTNNNTLDGHWAWPAGDLRRATGRQRRHHPDRRHRRRQYDSDAKFDRAIGPMQFILHPVGGRGSTPTATGKAQPAGHRRRRPRDHRPPCPGTTTCRPSLASGPRSTATPTARPTSTWS